MQVPDEDIEINDERNSLRLCVIATHVYTATICVYMWTLTGKGNGDMDKECERVKEENKVKEGPQI